MSDSSAMVGTARASDGAAGEMDTATLKALKGSIEKWEGIVAGTMEDDGILNCPLCDKFYHLDCEGCPVFQATGMDRCSGTPYIDTDLEDVPLNDRGGYDFYDCADNLAACKDELEFLRSLLPAPAATPDPIAPQSIAEESK